MKTLFKNATILDTLGEISGDMLIEDGLIACVTDEDKEIKADKIIDLNNKIIMPGFIDLHVHFRDPGLTYKEDIKTGSLASLKGGYTSVCAMANTKPVCDNPEILKYAFDKAKELNLINFIQISAIGKNLLDEEFAQIRKNLKYTTLFSNDGNTIFSDSFMKEALIKSSEFDFLLLSHSDPEAQIVKRDLGLLKEVGGNLHICHVSKKETIDEIIKAKDSGLKFSVEVTPNHVFSYDIDYKINPSIGSKEDNEAIIYAIKNDYIDVLASDHAPHSAEDKNSGAPGISSIEVAFNMYLTKFLKEDISLNRLSEMLSFNPAKLLKKKTGLLREGYAADFVIVDLDKKTKIDTSKFISKSNNNPFNAEVVFGEIQKTYVNGEKKYEINR